ncbi:MAG: hypothetical protein ACREON_14105 [Gemmatimonadaceae bacterium]
MTDRVSQRRGAPPVWRALVSAVGVAAILPLAACDLDVADPDVVRPPALQDPATLPTLLAGAIGDFAFAFAGDNGATEGIILNGGMRADEWLNADTFSDRQDIDQGTITEFNPSNQNVYRQLHTARLSAEFAAARFEDLAADEPGHAEALSLAAFTYVIFAEHYCSGTPFSDVDRETGAVIFGQPLTTEEMFEEAITRFDEALGVATAAGSSTQASLARVGRGRALIGLGRWAEAAAAVAGVPTGFQYVVEYSENTERQQNGVWVFSAISRRWSAANDEGTNGVEFRTANDPRARIEPLLTAGGQQRIGLDQDTPMWIQLEFPSRSAPIPLATGIGARLIEAEAALNQGNFATTLTILNTLRTNPANYPCPPGLQGCAAPGTPGGPPVLGPLADPGSAAGRVDLLFRERAFWLYSTAHRLGDMRRLIRPLADGGYGRAFGQVFPVGPYHKGGGLYGTDANLPVPIDEENNPNFQGCESRTI